MKSRRVVSLPVILEKIHLISFKIAACLVLLAGTAAAAETLAVVRVQSSPPNVPFSVDGQYYRGPASFVWPAGSKHTLTAEALLELSHTQTRYSFKRWAAGGTEIMPVQPTAVITADPAIGAYTVEYAVEYELRINFYNCPDSSCQSPGTVYVGGKAYTASVSEWVAAGATVTLQAVPNPGFVFLGWDTATGGLAQGFINKIVVIAPTATYPRFAVARRVRLETSPPGLRVFADRTVVPTPATLDWGIDTTHTLAPVSPQDDLTGNAWVFESWSDRGAATHAYKVPAGGSDAVITATYVRGARASFLTNPPGLKLRVDGRDNWMGYNFTWGVGETHRVAAPPEQSDAKGRTWRFREWSNGGPAEQEVEIAEQHVAAGLRLTALYEPLGRLEIQTTAAPGLSVEVDGQECRMPCRVERPMGAQVRVRAAATAPVSESSRLDFQGWNDGGPAERTVIIGAADQLLTSAYKLFHRLKVAAEPAEGVRWRLEPESADGFYGAGEQVMVAADVKPGYRFLHWEGDLTGSFATAVVPMTAPRAVLARLDPVPFVPPAGVRNAAAETPDPVVAPGSAIAILGVNLAPYAEGGPESPLAQTIAGVTVRLGSRMLPLYAVSPGQVNALLPSDVEEGVQTLAIKREGKPETRAEAQVARNAPGLFVRDVNGQAFAVAAHEDGSAVTPEAPARAGELITLYGTGFGPCLRTPPDGFAVPDTPAYPLADPVEILAGESVATPEFSGAAPGRVGVTAVRFRLGSGAGALELKARVNGRESNSVLLPVE